MKQTVTQADINKGDVLIKAQSVCPNGALVVDGRHCWRIAWEEDQKRGV